MHYTEHPRIKLNDDEQKMTNVKNRLKTFLLGVLLSLLPFVLAFGLAEFLFLTAEPADGPHQQTQRNHFAGIIVLIGFVMSAVAICGMGLYALDTLYRILIVERQARKIEKLRRERKI